MNSLYVDSESGLFSSCQPPCLSLYMPTHRRHPENQQDPIRFRNLAKKLEDSLRQKYSKEEIRPLMAPFLALADDREFWNHTLNGLAVLAARGLFRVYKLQRTVVELAVVADSLHTKPLLRMLQTAGRYQILGLSRQAITLFEGDRDVLDEIEPAQGVPRTITQALGDELTEPHQTVASYGGVGGSQSPMHHGHGGKNAELEIDAERFFRAVDRGILEHHSKPSSLPLILATLPENRELFRQVTHNPALIGEGIDYHPDALTIDELRAHAWSIVEPHYLARLAVLAEEFGTATSKNLGHGELAEVAIAVVAGRVASLLIEADRVIPGRIDTATGQIEFDDLSHPEVDDVLDDLGALASRMGGTVVVVPADRMPTKTGVAAVYRY